MALTFPTMSGVFTAPIKGIVGVATDEVIDQQMLTDATYGSAAIGYLAGSFRTKSVVRKTLGDQALAKVKSNLLGGIL